MFGIVVSLTKSWWHWDFVEAPNCSFCKNHSDIQWLCETHCQSKYTLWAWSCPLRENLTLAC